MSLEEFKRPAFQDTMELVLSIFIENLLVQNIEFSFIAELDDVNFVPELPEDALEGVEQSIFLSVQGYSFETAKVFDRFLLFEAGFGTDDIAYKVQVPLLAIKKIIKDEYVIFVNIAENRKQTTLDFPSFLTVNELSEYESKDIEESIESLLKHPDNREIFESLKKS